MTQKSQILAHLKAGYELSPLQALDKFGCFRLASVVFELKKEGHNIATIQGESVRSGRTKHFAIYKLVKSAQDKQLTFI